MPLFEYRTLCPVFLAGTLLLAPALNAKDKKPKTEPAAPQDAIEVVGHVPLTGGPVTRFLTTQHYSSYYLYAEHGSGGSVTLIDVSNSNSPAVLSGVSYSASPGTETLSVVAGTAALVTQTPAATPAPAPQTLRIMDFSNPQNPKVAREFTGVTAMTRDDRRGLIFVANQDGVWILQQHLAQDPEVQKAYDHYILYTR
jgi:hypothetical protein